RMARSPPHKPLPKRVGLTPEQHILSYNPDLIVTQARSSVDEGLNVAFNRVGVNRYCEGFEILTEDFYTLSGFIRRQATFCNLSPQS
ncbi:MAG: hypothetical protein Q605_AUC01167G0001, partial [Actinomyces urogenitalis DORA_12]